MYPTLFTVAGFKIDTYSVVWFIALSVAILWSIKRLELYELDDDESRKIMSVSFLFMLLGAMVFKHIGNLKIFIDDPSLLLKLHKMGLSEFGAVLGAFISAFVMCFFSRKVSFLKLCDVAAIPAMLTIAIGRWGCFLNGCCVGIQSKFFMAVHFPRDPAGITRHPVQIYYSIIAAVSVLILIYVEKKIMPKLKNNYHSVTAPLALILYSLMRFSTASLRENMSLIAHILDYSENTTYTILAIAFPLECLWLAFSLLRLKLVKK